MRALPPPGPRRYALLALVAASAVSGILAWNDLNERPDDEVRGDKRLWRAAIIANSGNSAAYWLLGRKRA